MTVVRARRPSAGRMLETAVVAALLVLHAALLGWGYGIDSVR